MSSTHIRCIVGLGNPGGKYEDTRHNVGFWLVDRLAKKHGGSFRNESKFSGEVARINTPQGDVWLLKPTTFMNHSGRSVSALAKFYRIQPEEILVAHDELDMEAGVIRLKKGGGHGGHNGLRDIVSAIGSKDFQRVRIGIGHPGHKSAVSGYVLSRPGKAEQEKIETGLDLLDRHWDAVLSGNLGDAMQAVHTAT